MYTVYYALYSHYSAQWLQGGSLYTNTTPVGADRQIGSTDTARSGRS